jgi:hypothetical protein
LDKMSSWLTFLNKMIFNLCTIKQKKTGEETAILNKFHSQLGQASDAMQMQDSAQKMGGKQQFEFLDGKQET